MPSGRFAPSPTGELHLGNLRTALLAWLCARSTGRGFVVRMEDLDRQRCVPGADRQQLTDLAALGLDWDGEVRYQSRRLEWYEAAVDCLTSSGLTYPCYCTRREIREAASAPQPVGAPGAQRYPGTCRNLTASQRSGMVASGRPPALRLRALVGELTIRDALHNNYAGSVEDIVLRRNDGLPAYHVAVVVDDADQGVDQVVRGDDLLTITPSQAHLADLLGLPTLGYVHVPLVINADGRRLAKRDGAVTMAELAAKAVRPAQVLGALAVSLGLARPGEAVSLPALLERFEIASIPVRPWVLR
ncbi:MAG: tRNA glutamyl-Q(34) synthetase GluQRS [Nocardioides sp.]